MSVPAADQTQKHWTTTRPIFFASLLVTIITFTLEFGSSFLLRPLISNPFPPGANSFELYNLIMSLLNLAFSPLLVFVVFYKLSPRLDIDVHSRYYAILWSAFSGSFVGGVLAYLIISILSVIANGYSIFGPSFDPLSIAGLAVAEARVAVIAAAIVFVGIILGSRLPAGSAAVGGTEPQGPLTQEFNGQTPLRQNS